MLDSEIRASYKEIELSKHSTNECRIVDELHLSCVGVRADIAIINGSLHGIEIKGANDSLLRLQNQINGYSKVFDYVTIVTEDKHIDKIINSTPAWVNVVICHKSAKGKITFKKLHKGSKNVLTEPIYVAKLLWRDEIIDILNEHNIGYLKKDRNWLLCDKLCKGVEKKLVSKIVRDKLKSRADWKVNL